MRRSIMLSLTSGLGVAFLLGACSPRQQPARSTDERFASNAFPPTIPTTDWHQLAWKKNDSCLLCHESGANRAPIIQHKGLPPIVKQAACRSCHVLRESEPPQKLAQG